MQRVIMRDMVAMRRNLAIFPLVFSFILTNFAMAAGARAARAVKRTGMYFILRLSAVVTVDGSLCVAERLFVCRRQRKCLGQVHQNDQWLWASFLKSENTQTFFPDNLNDGLSDNGRKGHSTIDPMGHSQATRQVICLISELKISKKSEGLRRILYTAMKVWFNIPSKLITHLRRLTRVKGYEIW